MMYGINEAINDVFSMKNLWYWIIVGIIFCMPIFQKIWDKIRIYILLPKESFEIVMDSYNPEIQRYSIFGRQKMFIEVNFKLNKLAQRVMKRESEDFDDSPQIFKMQIPYDDFLILRKFGINNETGLSATFSRNRFGQLYFLKLNNAIKDLKIPTNNTGNMIETKNTIASNDTIYDKNEGAQLDLQKKHRKFK